MEGERRVLQHRVEPLPSNGAGSSRMNGLEVMMMNSRKATAIEPCTASTLACS